MGHQKSRRDKFFKQHPYCCFCGGEEAAVEIEHMPSRTMFKGKHRPSGFEFPICRSCNDISRKSEAVVAFLAFSGSDISIEREFDIDLQRLMNFMKVHCRGTIDEILGGVNGSVLRQKKLKKLLNTDVKIVELGEITKSHLDVFNSKMAIALFYQLTGRPLSIRGGVNSVIHNLVNVVEGTFPNFQFDFPITEFDTMKQGAWSVERQFVFRYSITSEMDAAFFQFMYHNTFIVSSFVFDDVQQSIHNNVNWHIPGNLTAVDDKAFNPFFSIKKSYSHNIYSLNSYNVD